MTRLRVSSVVGTFLAAAVLSYAPLASAQNPGECASGFCGTPDTDGGGCGCGCGCSILVNYTDMGETYSTSDDFDNDGFEDDFDNCPFSENRDQVDGDGDGIGNGCDNAPQVSNPDQLDTDGDGKGDVDDVDMDGDGINNTTDNCVKVANPTQRATTTERGGDACNPDDDNDGLLDIEDPCPKISGTIAIGGRACDDDEDLDAVLDASDNCPSISNAGQSDRNTNGMGDACDPDMDGDGILNNLDNAPIDPNPDQLDADRDGLGDIADAEFCYVYNRLDTKSCLNPRDTFKVAAVSIAEQFEAGKELKLVLLSNRKDTPIEYTWAVESRPAGSEAVVQNAAGKVVTSEGKFEYRYQLDQLPTFVPDEPGTYELKLVGKLLFADDEFAGGPTVAQHTLKLEVAGGSQSSGCTTTRGDNSLGALVLVGFGMLVSRLRRRRA